MAAHVPALLYLGCACLCLLSSWHDNAGMRAAPSHDGHLWWLTGHVNGFSLYQRELIDAVCHHSPMLLCSIVVNEWSLGKYGWFSKWGLRIIWGPLRITVGPQALIVIYFVWHRSTALSDRLKNYACESIQVILVLSRFTLGLFTMTGRVWSLRVVFFACLSTRFPILSIAAPTDSTGWQETWPVIAVRFRAAREN